MAEWLEWELCCANWYAWEQMITHWSIENGDIR